MAVPAPVLPTKSLNGQKIPFEVLAYIPEDSATHYRFIPIGIEDGVLEVGMVNPDDMEARDALQFIATRLELPFKIFQISAADFAEAVKNYTGIGSQVGKALGELDEELKTQAAGVILRAAPKTVSTPSIVEEAPVTKIVGVILQHAAAGNASDIHIEPIEGKIKVRFRVDGTLYTSLFLPPAALDQIVARIKILTNMQLDEKRKPQDGRFSATIEGRKIDFRVSTFPTAFGEKVVIRILDPQKNVTDLEHLGLDAAQRDLLLAALNKPYGLILMTGPTGSGKTTTLYSLLSQLDREKYNVVSLEDPIEYNIEGVNQSQIRPEINYSFANGLRSILRQDPDIIMVGEIRDKETARLAIQAALTGHLVLSTLHTNNAAGVVPRLIDMGIDPYLIAPTLILAAAQRLVPRICDDSKEAVPVEGAIRTMYEKQFEDLPAEYRQKLEFTDTVYRAHRSPSCPAGTRGRIAVFEMFEITKDIERLIMQSPSDLDIYKAVRQKGFLTMKEDAIRKALQGIIPFEEVNKL